MPTATRSVSRETRHQRALLSPVWGGRTDPLGAALRELETGEAKRIARANAAYDESHKVALEHALWSLEDGMTPRDVLEAIGFKWPRHHPRDPEWKDVVDALAVRWRQRATWGGEVFDPDRDQAPAQRRAAGR